MFLLKLIEEISTINHNQWKGYAWIDLSEETKFFSHYANYMAISSLINNEQSSEFCQKTTTTTKTNKQTNKKQFLVVFSGN